MLNCLSDFIPDKERIVTIEDTAELQLAKEHVVRLETKGANVEGRGECFTLLTVVNDTDKLAGSTLPLTVSGTQRIGADEVTRGGAPTPSMFC